MEPISKFIAGLEWVLLADIFIGALNIPHVADHDQRSMNRIVACLGQQGWIRHQRRVLGKPKWGYIPDPSIDRVVTEQPDIPGLE